jgi:hypothetical protein
MPTEFNDTFNDYLKLQDSQGFNLKKYAGENVTIYVYDILNYPDYPSGIQANMIIANDRLIGGEIRQNIDNGFIVPLLTVSYVKPYGQSSDTDTAASDGSVTTVSGGNSGNGNAAAGTTVCTTVSAVQPTITIVTTTATAAPQVVLEDAMYTGGSLKAAS